MHPIIYRCRNATDLVKQGVDEHMCTAAFRITMKMKHTLYHKDVT